ncbi:hypothetical protein ACIRVI_32250, partial [[Kitasatospora] papulosa]
TWCSRALMLKPVLRTAAAAVTGCPVRAASSAATLAKLIHAQDGDRGGAEWLVVPDYRARQVPLLSGVCKKYDMRVAAASEFGEMVCEKAGVSWT